MLNLNTQKTNIRNTVNTLLDNFLYSKTPYFINDRKQYFAIDYNDFSFVFMNFLDEEKYLKFNFVDHIFSDIKDLDGKIREKYDEDEIKRKVIRQFLKSTEEEISTYPNFADAINEQLLYNNSDIRVNNTELELFFENNVFLPESKKYKVDISNQMIKTAYCRYTKDMLNAGKVPADDSIILEYLKRNEDTTPVIDYILKLNKRQDLKEDNIEPYLFQVMKEEAEISYLHSYIRKTLRNVTLFSKVRTFKNNELLKSYNSKGEYDITRHDVFCLYHYAYNSLDEIITFLTEDYSIYEIDKKTKEKELKEKFIPIIKLNDKIYVQKIIRILKKNY